MTKEILISLIRCLEPNPSYKYYPDWFGHKFIESMYLGNKVMYGWSVDKLNELTEKELTNLYLSLSSRYYSTWIW